MEQGIQIHYFAHYFVLIIGFTFAYGGLKGFKDYINKVALSKGKFDLSYKVRINGLKDKLTLLKGATITQLIQAKIDKADVLLSELLENEDLAERIYDGRSFQSMFFLTGVIYLSLLIVGGFHQPQLNKPFYLLITTITIGANIYFIKVLLVIRQEAKGEFSHKHSDWRNSFKVIRFYAIGFVIGIIVWVLAAPFIPNPHFCNQHFKLLDYYDFSKGKLFKDFLMLFVIHFQRIFLE